ncbi:NAD-dependent epimerase/dehydratase family protein [Peribacillus alkalitolerans]|uniref:NAD-dependent epimerase/dehydratase family protein n=1 Tax=Peribacillus alkalitolerans TaxID=1550385 RepID=UPI0013D50975|nr:NAD-dependent epimerase/dehydratase family protein [Peribacillus alkalitolerans]
MSVLITGGAGFIGTFTKKALKEHGYDIVLVDNFVTGNRNNIDEDDVLIEKDIREDDLFDSLKDRGIESIIHLAAQTSVPDSVNDPLYDESENIEATIKMLMVAKKLGVKKFIFASSAAVYGNNPACPLKESERLYPTSPYGISKMTGEQYVQVLCNQYGIEPVILRYANVFGPKQSNEGEGGVIKIFIDKIIKNDTLQIFGDGGQTRDFIYVEDIAFAHLQALQSPGGLYNVGTNTEVSVNELVDILKKVSQKDLNVEYGAPREGDIYRSCLDNTEISQKFDWQPKFTFEEGLKKTYEAFKESK